jgi:hypothetical protein
MASEARTHRSPRGACGIDESGCDRFRGEGGPGGRPGARSAPCLRNGTGAVARPRRPAPPPRRGSSECHAVRGRIPPVRRAAVRAACPRCRATSPPAASRASRGGVERRGAGVGRFQQGRQPICFGAPWARRPLVLEHADRGLAARGERAAQAATLLFCDAARTRVSRETGWRQTAVAFDVGHPGAAHYAPLLHSRTLDAAPLAPVGPQGYSRVRWRARGLIRRRSALAPAAWGSSHTPHRRGPGLLAESQPGLRPCPRLCSRAPSPHPASARQEVPSHHATLLHPHPLGGRADLLTARRPIRPIDGPTHQFRAPAAEHGADADGHRSAPNSCRRAATAHGVLGWAPLTVAFHVKRRGRRSATRTNRRSQPRRAIT